MSSRNSLLIYILRRIVEAVPLMFGVIVVNFVLIHLAPGDPASIFAGEMASPQYLATIRQSMGLDQPLYVQFYVYFQKILSFDLGYSLQFRTPVTVLLIPRISNTFLLMGTAWILATTLGVLLGVIASTRPHSKLDNLVQISSLAGYSIPSFWLGQILVLIFSIYLGFLPAQGMISLRGSYEGLDLVVDLLSHFVLPVSTLTLINLAMISRITRTSMLETKWQDYITTARAKGLSERTIVFRHQLRNALLPVVTISGMNFGVMLAGAALTESVFSWPGIGSLILTAISLRDYPILMGVFVVSSMLAIGANLVTDIIYAFLDPRIRY